MVPAWKVTIDAVPMPKYEEPPTLKAKSDEGVDDETETTPLLFALVTKKDGVVEPAAMTAKAWVVLAIDTDSVAKGEVVPMPRNPAEVRRMPSLSPEEDFLIKKARSAVGEVVETLVNTEAILAVEVAVVVALEQFASEQKLVSLNRRPVPIPAAEVEVAKCVSEKTSEIAAEE